MEDFDRSFIRGVFDRCGGSLDLAVEGEEIGQALGLDEAQTEDVVARLMRTGFVRDVAAHFRIKITARGIAVARLEPPSIAAVPLPDADVSKSGTLAREQSVVPLGPRSPRLRLANLADEQVHEQPVVPRAVAAPLVLPHDPHRAEPDRDGRRRWRRRRGAGCGAGG